MMTTTRTRIVVSDGPYEAHGVAHRCVHHRDFPENLAQGESPALAARYLLNLFEKNLDSVGGAGRRAAVERAMTDVRSFLAGLERRPEAEDV